MAHCDVLDRFFDPLTNCLTPEVAERILAVELDAAMQARLGELAAKADHGQLSPEEDAEYAAYIEGMDLVGIFKAKARSLLHRTS